MLYKIQHFLCLFGLCFALPIFAQKGSVRGNIYDQTTGQPLPYVSVQIQETTSGANTDLNGFFVIPNLNNGKYTLIATYLGYDTLFYTFNIQNNIQYKDFYLKESTITLDAVEISGKKEKKRAEVTISQITITPKQLQNLPSTGGVSDVAQYLPVLPGVISTGDQGGQIYIRGGSPIQNKVLLDGMTIYNPFHSIGLFSVFETENIRSVDVLTGGFGAEYGGRTSAIVDVRTREGNRKRFAGVVAANPFQSSVLVEGPISKLKEEGGSSSSFMLTAKRSWLAETSKTLYDYATPTGSTIGLPFNFTDLYGKISFIGGNGSKFNIFGFNFDDAVKYTGIADFSWKNTGGGANFTLIPNNSEAIINGLVSFSNYKSSFLESQNAPRTSGIRSLNALLDFSYFGENSKFNYGVELTAFRTDFAYRNAVGLTFSQNDNTTEIGAFVKYRKKIRNLVLEPSVRLQYYASLQTFRLEPRLGLKYSVNEHIRLKLAGGLYSQNLLSTVNERDIVNLFVGFLAGPEQTIYKPNSTDVASSRLQTAIHGVAGMEIDLAKGLELNIEPYYKKYTQLIAINRNKLKGSDPDFVTETGNAYGIDFSAKYDHPKFSYWLTYSLAYVNRNDGKQTYPTIFDRRHNINALATYHFGANRAWEASARWNFGTGFPFTLTQGFYTNFDFSNGIGTDVLTGNPNIGIIYAAERNSGRLPAYHRLDVSLKRIFSFSKYLKLELNASVTNVYDRKNIFYFDRINYQRINQLPILPSLGATLRF